MKKRKEQIAFEYIGKNGTFILTKVLSEAPKGEYKQDRINLLVKSKKENWSKIMTPYEAIVISNALLQAVLIDNESRKKLK